MSQYIHVVMTAAVAFPFIAILITFPILLINYHKYGSIPKWNIFMLYTFVFYLLCAYFLIILPLPPLSYVEHLTTPKYNLKPFTFILEFIKYNPFSPLHPGTWVAALKAPTVIQPVFNMVLTVPFGLYLRYYFKRNIKQTILISFLLSLFFEITQLSGLYGIYPRPYRLFDIDDLMLNTLGGVIGFLLAGPLLRWLPTRENVMKRASSLTENVSVFRRAVAFIFDMIVVFALSIIFNFVPVIRDFGFALSLIILVVIPQIIWGKSLGMRMVRIKVTDQYNQKPLWWQVIIRNIFAYGLSGGLVLVWLKMLELTGTISRSYLGIVHISIIIITVFIVLILADFLLESFSKKHRLYFEHLSKTDTKNTYR
ncbi:teicoplanin resistance protein VanZ [Lentilactobacillus curieae]|uniref:Teicoplanin resistance protein VanZ n=1 Tax=Lentilactobacillus curieae TaxID=1138822 RepID=A0A1S6QGZ4_9LACO|nr:VanZ family protein [Lentilactobacillus curieae]AQW20869.1 teicoplanin resistance protein VanZ [Lentilactobacillus curieae]